jgi:prefoldin subunit 5
MITDNDIVAKVNEIGNTVWQLENKVAMLQRAVDLLLINDPECEATKYFVERAKRKRERQEASDKAQEKIREMRGEIERLLGQHPDLREINER